MDDYSRYCVVVPLKAKSEAGKFLLDTIVQLEVLTGKKVSRIGEENSEATSCKKLLKKEELYLKKQYHTIAKLLQLLKGALEQLLPWGEQSL